MPKLSEKLQVRIADAIRGKINPKTHYLVVKDGEGVIVERTFNGEGIEELHHAPWAYEFMPLIVVLREIRWDGTHA